MKSKKIFLPFLLLLCVCVLVAWFLLSKVSKKPTLKILTYSSFAGVYSPGRFIKKEFESFCKCEIQWFLAEDSTALFQRFSLISDIDVVIGWDQISRDLSPKELWENLAPLQEKMKYFYEIENLFNVREDFFTSDFFLPIDWAPVGFLYKDKTPSLVSLNSLLKIKGRISFPEPRTSTLGFQFYYWIYEMFKGDKTKITHFLKQLKPKIYGPLFSWSMAYGLFQKGHTDLGLSYLSSLIYHEEKETENRYSFSYFKEGHPYQVETLSISKISQKKKLAFDFAIFLLSPKVQKQIMKSHYMFSVSKELGVNAKLKKIKLISYNKLEEFLEEKEMMIRLWEDLLH